MSPTPTTEQQYTIPAKQKILRSEESKLDVIIVGAGLGGLGAAISILLSGHNVLVLESASEIAEVGAGIQILPPSSAILQSWGLLPRLLPHATYPKCVNMLRWEDGTVISSMDFKESAKRWPGRGYWDFHRANLHRALYDRAVELGARIRVNSRVVDVQVMEGEGEGEGRARVVLGNGEEVEGDLVVGADGINSKLRELMLGYEDPPVRTGDLAYRLLLSTKEMVKDPELEGFVKRPEVNYWLGPQAHCVNYVLRGGLLFNMVLLVPDDMPADGASTLEGNVEEMRALFKDWDPRIGKLLGMCESVYKWRLCIRPGMESWSHPSATWTMLGDAVHATLPYLASGAGMALEDAAVLGECLSRLPIYPPSSPSSSKPTKAEKSLALKIYEQTRKGRTSMVVERGNLQQYLYHLPDGEEQEERDRKMRMVPTPPGEALAWRDPGLSGELLGYDCVRAVEENWPREEEQLLEKEEKEEIEVTGQAREKEDIQPQPQPQEEGQGQIQSRL